MLGWHFGHLHQELLTRPEDKLVALSGLVKEISLILNDNYLADLWKNRFASQLLWSVSKANIANNGNPSFKPETYRTPGPGRQ